MGPHLSSHLGNDDVAGEGIGALNGVQLIVEDEGVQAAGDVVQGDGVIISLIGVGVPVGSQGGNGRLPNVVALGEGLDDHLGFGLDGLGVNGLGVNRLVVAAGKCNQHGQSQQQCDKLFHSFILLL